MSKRTDLQDRIQKFKLDSNYFKGLVLRDLHKIYINLVDKAVELDKELVNCRRLQKFTSHYQTLEKELENMLDFAEQQLTFASLLDR